MENLYEAEKVYHSHTPFEYVALESSSYYQKSSSPLESLMTGDRRVSKPAMRVLLLTILSPKLAFLAISQTWRAPPKTNPNRGLLCPKRSSR